MQASKLKSVLTMAALLGTVAFTAPSVASDDVFNDKERAAIEQIVRDYLIKNPDILIEMSKALEEQHSANLEANMQEAIAYFLHDEAVPYKGDKDADHYLIEFFDYNCGYCKVVREHTKRLAQENDVRTVFVEFPILSPVSVRASAIGLALHSVDKEKYLKYQDYLMSSKSRVSSDADIKKAVEHVGGDYEQLLKIMNDDPKIQNALRTNLEIGQKIGVQGTPFFILDGNVVRGAVKDYDTLKDLLSDSKVEIPAPLK